MKLKIDEKQEEIEFEGKILKLLEKLSLNPEGVVVLKNGEVVSEDERVRNTDEVEIISVASRG